MWLNAILSVALIRARRARVDRFVLDLLVLAVAAALGTVRLRFIVAWTSEYFLLYQVHLVGAMGEYMDPAKRYNDEQ